MSKDIESNNQIDWDDHAKNWDNYDEAKDYAKQIFALLRNRINLNNQTVLDFGCGTGLLIDHMRHETKQIVGLDSSKKMIEVLNNKNYENVETIIGELTRRTIENHPILKIGFDLIVASSVCAFLPNYNETLGLISSLLKPNGIFIQWDWLITEKDPDFGFNEELIGASYSSVGLLVDSVSIPFYMVENNEKMEVIMAVGKLQ